MFWRNIMVFEGQMFISASKRGRRNRMCDTMQEIKVGKDISTHCSPKRWRGHCVSFVSMLCQIMHAEPYVLTQVTIKLSGF